MADGNGHRHRFAAVVLGLVVAAAVLAVFPVTAAFGTVLCLLLVIPAVVAVWRTRRAPVGTRRRSVAALVVAPVFLLVGAGVVGAGSPPRPPVTVVAEAAPARVPAAVPTSEPAAVAPLAAAPTSAQAPAVVAAAAAAPEAVGPQSVIAPQPVAPQPVAPQPIAPRPATLPPAAPQQAAAKPAAPQPVAASSCGASSYINSSGNCVPRPVAAAAPPAGATAQCKDSEYSFSQRRQGTCSGHGGVARWL